METVNKIMLDNTEYEIEDKVARQKLAELDGRYELIESVAIREDTQNIVLSTEPDGTPYSFKGILIDCRIYGEYAGSSISIEIRDKSGRSICLKTFNVTVDHPRLQFRCYFDHGLACMEYALDASSNPLKFSKELHMSTVEVVNYSAISRAIISGALPAPTDINVYGLRT